MAAYLQKGLPESAGTYGMDSVGYLTLFDHPDIRQCLFPVDPTDVQIAVKAAQPNMSGNFIHAPAELPGNKLICLGDLCYDRSGYLVGKATSDVMAKETMVVSIDKFGDIQEVAQTQQTAQAPSQQAMQRLAQHDASAWSGSIEQAVAKSASGSPHSEPKADTSDWPDLTLCIQKMETAQSAGVSAEMDNEFAAKCKAMGQ